MMGDLGGRDCSRLSSSTEVVVSFVTRSEQGVGWFNWTGKKCHMHHTSKLQRLLRLAHLVHGTRVVVSVFACLRTASHATRDCRHASQLENCLRRRIRLESMIAVGSGLFSERFLCGKSGRPGLLYGECGVHISTQSLLPWVAQSLLRMSEPSQVPLD